MTTETRPHRRLVDRPETVTATLVTAANRVLEVGGLVGNSPGRIPDSLRQAQRHAIAELADYLASAPGAVDAFRKLQ